MTEEEQRALFNDRLKCSVELFNILTKYDTGIGLSSILTNFLILVRKNMCDDNFIKESIEHMECIFDELKSYKDPFVSIEKGSGK